jgi:hypothetical protein
MTATEVRLSDALDAAAQTIRAETLRPLLIPERRRHRLAWAAPLVAAASLPLVVGLRVAVTGHLPWSGPPGGAVTAPRAYYVDGDQYGHRPVVRSTVTGAATATVEIPHVQNAPEPDLVAAAANGAFFAAVSEPAGVLIYRFRLTGAGRVSQLAPLKGGPLAGRLWAADAMAASPDGSSVAVALTFTGGAAGCGSSGGPACTAPGTDPDYIEVVSTATGSRTTWRGGMSGRHDSFSVVNLSWTGNARELVFLGQFCPDGVNGIEHCVAGTGTGGRTTEVWALNHPASRGGPLDSGRLLLRQSPSFPYIAQALIGPSGSVITAAVLTGPVTSTDAVASRVTEELSVEQIAVSTGKPLRVLYSREMGRTTEVHNGPDYLTLAADGAGQYLLGGGMCTSNAGCSGGFNGWIDGGRLVPLQPGDGSVFSEAW